MRVFKYRGGNENIFIRDLESLEQDTFWAPTSSNLNDPCEGLILYDELLSIAETLDQLTNKYAQEHPVFGRNLSQSVSSLVEKKDSSGIYSLSKTHTDELLWAHYASNHEGFCIEYNLETLVSFGGVHYETFDVKYSQHPPRLNMQDMLKTGGSKNFVQKIIGFKSLKWAHEQEIRIITPTAGIQRYDFRSVKSIYFGIRMPEDRKQELMKRLSGRGINYHEMFLKDQTYSLDSKRINNPHPEASKYLYSIAPIAELAVDPSTLNDKWLKFSPYLTKMAEIIRREPYCNQLDLVDVSITKSKPGKPVFFAQYQRAENKYVNIYLTPEEIDERYSNITDLGRE